MQEEPDSKRQRLHSPLNKSNGYNNGHEILMSSEEPEATSVKILHILEATANELQEALDLHTLPDVPEVCRLQPNMMTAKRLLTYSHRLSYTSFAAQSSIGQQLFRPPAPQEWDFKASVLHRLSGTGSPVPKTDSEQIPEKTQEIPETDLSSKKDENISEPQFTEPPPSSKPVFEFNNSALDFTLNDDMEEVEEEFSSSEEESE